MKIITRTQLKYCSRNGVGGTYTSYYGAIWLSSLNRNLRAFSYNRHCKSYCFNTIFLEL